MKKPHLKLSYCILFIFIYSINNYAQESKPVQTSDAKLPKNEVKINAFTLIAFGAIDITYERVLNNESSAGISIYVLGQNNIDSEFYRTFSLTPYYRSYFSDMYNKGFFIELFAMAYSREDEYYNSYDSIENGYTTSNYETEKHTGAALGISVGGKWVTKTGFIAEISLGIGRVMIGNTNDEVPVVGRGGITIGKRF